MSRLRHIFSLLVLLTPYSSAQITSGGSVSTTGLISDLLGLNFSEPYVLIGFAATFALMWLSIYIIFKVGIEKIDSSYGGRRNTPFADALGLDDENSRNILAILTLLITLSTVGTGAFTGLIRGWQSLVLLLFAFMLLAGLMLVLIGGTGGIIGGTAYTTGKAAKIASKNIEKMKEDVNEIRNEEETLDDIEDEIREEEKDARRREKRDDDSGGASGSDSGERGGNHSSGDSSSRSDTGAEINDIIQKLLKALRILEDIEEKLSKDLSKESERIEERRNQLEEIRKILTSDKEPYNRLRYLIKELEKKGIDSSSSMEDLEKVLQKHNISYPDTNTLQEYIIELRELEQSLANFKKEISVLKKIEKIIERLQSEIGGAEKEEEILKDLIKRLEDSEIKEEFINEVEDEERELDEIEDRFNRLKQFISKIKELLDRLERLENDLGNIDSLTSKLDELRSVAEMLWDHSSDVGGAHNPKEMLSFNPKYDNYIEKGTKFTVPGSKETAIIDISIKLTPSTNPDELEFNNPQKNLILQIGSIISRELSRESKGIELEGIEEFKQKRHTGDGDLDVEGLMRMIFKIIIENKSISKEGGEYYLTKQIRGPKYNSELMNAIYLGSLINDLTATYSTAMKKFENEGEGRALTKPSIMKYEAKSEVFLSSYSNNGAPEPVILVNDPDGLHGFLIRSEKLIENINEDNLSGAYILD